MAERIIARLHYLVPAAALVAILANGISLAHSAEAHEVAGAPCRCLACQQARAGNPQAVARHAQSSYTFRETGCYVGGGAAFHGEPRTSDEGTWGWDYQGLLVDKRIWLNWWHGQRAQGSGGAYRTDGPRVLHAR